MQILSFSNSRSPIGEISPVWCWCGWSCAPLRPCGTTALNFKMSSLLGFYGVLGQFRMNFVFLPVEVELVWCKGRFISNIWMDSFSFVVKEYNQVWLGSVGSIYVFLGDTRSLSCLCGWNLYRSKSIVISYRLMKVDVEPKKKKRLIISTRYKNTWKSSPVHAFCWSPFLLSASVRNLSCLRVKVTVLIYYFQNKFRVLFFVYIIIIHKHLNNFHVHG